MSDLQPMITMRKQTFVPNLVSSLEAPTTANFEEDRKILFCSSELGMVCQNMMVGDLCLDDGWGLAWSLIALAWPVLYISSRRILLVA
jgi:hypothetical protein